MSPKVVVIGAGAAGIAAAAKLHQNQFDVIVLEASDRIGGRIRTLKTTEGWLEMGAQWVHGVDQWLYDYAKTHDILGTEVHMAQQSGLLFEKQELTAQQPQKIVGYSNEFFAHLDPEVLKATGPECSVGKHLKRKYIDDVKQARSPEEHLELESAYDWVIRKFSGSARPDQNAVEWLSDFSAGIKFERNMQR